MEMEDERRRERMSRNGSQMLAHVHYEDSF